MTVDDTLDRVSEGYDAREDMSTQNLRDKFMDDFEDFRDLLEEGDVRAAEKNNEGDWEANPRVKEGILLSFSLGENAPFEGGYMEFQDKDTLPPQETFDEARVVPGGSSIRSGAHVGDIIQMPPSYINVGAHVGDGTMVDSEALVASAAQIGEDVHLSTGAKTGGVLEPVEESPVIVEDEAFLGGNTGVYGGVVVREGAVLAPGTQISSSTPIYDTVEDEVYSGEVPENAVVIPGSVEYGEVQGESLNKQVPIVAKYKDASTEAETALEGVLRD